MGSLKLNGSTSGHVEITAPAVAGTQSVEFPTDVVQKSEYRGHNLLHNGAMQVCQRGTSVTSITNGGYYTADRWAGGITGSVGTWTHSVENDAPTGSGFRKSLKILCSAADASLAAGDFASLNHVIEGQNLQSIKKGTANAEQLTLSFWVKSNKTGTYIVELYDNDNTRHAVGSYTVDASGTWEQQTITFPADTTGAFDNDNAASLYVIFGLAAGTNFTSGTLATTWAAYSAANRAVGQVNLASDVNNYFQLTGVKLETGPVATAFDHKSYGEELAECQRYYWKTTQGHQCMAQAYTTANAIGFFNYPVPMRAAPSGLAHVGAATDYYVYNKDATPLTLSAVPTYLIGTVHQMSVTLSVASGLVAGYTTICGSVGAAGVFGFSADL